MNTVGKILVILNFVFVLIVLALLVMDAAVRNQWKLAYYAMENEAKVLKAGRDADVPAKMKLTNEYQANTLERQALTQKEIDTAKNLNDIISVKDIQINDQKLELEKNLATVNASTATIARLTTEVDLLTKTIKDREALIVKLEADYKIIYIQAQTYEANFKAANGRAQSLLEKLREETLANARKEGGIKGDRGIIRNPNEPNPPAVEVNGKVKKVEGDLMSISLGTDHGVEKNNTLDIYRLSPEPKYLGMIRIVDANHHESVARLIPSGNQGFRPQLREGDLVTSKLTK